MIKFWTGGVLQCRSHHHDNVYSDVLLFMVALLPSPFSTNFLFASSLCIQSFV